MPFERGYTNEVTLWLLPLLSLAPVADGSISPKPSVRQAEATMPAVAEPASSLDNERSTAGFIAPLTIVSGAAWAPASHSKPIVFVLLGVNFRAADLEWCVDLALMQREPDSSMGLVGPRGGAASIGMQGFTGGWLSWGPIFQSDSRALHGFFVSPKLTLGVFFVGRNELMVHGLLGADVGYQLTLGRLYFAFMLGASLGVGFGDNDIWAGPLAGVPFSSTPSAARFAVGLNLQLFRAGFTF